MIATLAIDDVEGTHRHRRLARAATPMSSLRRHARLRSRSGSLHRRFKFRRQLLREQARASTQSRRRRFPGRPPSRRRRNAVSRKRLRNMEATEIRMQKYMRVRECDT